MRSKPWGAPGPDRLPLGFLKACGPPFLQALLPIAQASFRLSYFPKAFKEATVIVIPKPGKTQAQLRKAGGWRPISLLSATGKILEATLASRLARAAEEAGILPDEQMGCRPGRLTESAIRLLTE